MTNNKKLSILRNTEVRHRDATARDEPCKLIKKFSPEFVKMIDSTKSDYKERGVNFCPNNGEIVLSKICIGEKCEIPKLAESILQCKDKRPAMGSLHTHPGIGSEEGEMSKDDVVMSIAKGERFACIGYRGIAKTVKCYSYPYGTPQDIADKFKAINYLELENKTLNEITKYGKMTHRGYVPKPDTSDEQWEKLRKEVDRLTEIKDGIKTHANSDDAKEERSRNSCTIFLAPLS